MSEARHTPGPWWVSGPHTDLEPIGIGCVDPGYPTADGKRLIAIVFDGFPREPENAANARLIAAAPELFAELNGEDVRWFLTNAINGDISGDDPETLRRLVAMRDRITLLIRKAKGETT